MPRNGSGSFSFASGYPFTTGTVISSTDVNAVLLDIANTFTASIAKDGQTTATADIPMGGFKFTSVGDAALRTQFPSVGQLQDDTLRILSGVAGTNTITGALTPSIATTGYVTGMKITFTPAISNTGATTLSVNSLAAKNVYAWGAACVGGELVAGRPAVVVYDGTQFQILNPQGGTLAAFSLSASNLTSGTVPDARFPATLPALSGANLTNLNATNLASGTVADARLSANVPLLVGGVLSGSLISGGAFGAVNGSALTSLTAANVTGSQTLPDGVLSANVPLLNAKAIFTASGATYSAWAVEVQANVPVYGMRETSAGANAKEWYRYASGGVLHEGVADDAVGTLVDYVTVTRSAASVAALAFAATSITLNGVAASDFARLSQSNTFTNGTQKISVTSGSTQFEVKTTDAAGQSELKLTNSAGSWSLYMSAANSTLRFHDGTNDRFMIAAGGNYDFKGGTVTTNNASASEVGYKGVPQNSQSVSYTTVLADAGKNLHQTGPNKTFTIDSNATVAFPIGTVLNFTCDNATGVLIAITTDTLRLAGTATTGTRTLAQYGVATAIKILSTTWIISGAGLT